MAKKEKFDFEKSLSSLTTIVEKLEKGDLNLETALKEFESGVQLSRQCQTALKEAEQTIQVLTQNNGDAQLEPFNEKD